MEGNIIQLKEYHLNKGASKDHTPVFPMTKASAIEGMAELLKDLKISGVTPANSISDVSSPEKGKIYYEESTDKYYVYSEDKSSFIELGAGASVDPSDLMPTVTQTTSSEQSGGDNIITFTFPNGETTQVVIKNGQQGNSGYTGAAGELEVVNNLKDGGATAALSAEMGKELAQQSIIESGTFAKAYLKAVDVNVPFPWVLKDTDGNGNSITKMIWHIGDREFVDAIGADVNWYKDGITLITNAPCALRVRHVNDANSDNVDVIIPKAGLHHISFSELTTENHPTEGIIAQGYFSKVIEEKVGGAITYVPNTQTYDDSPANKSIDVTYVNFGGLKTSQFTFYSFITSLDPSLTRNNIEMIENLHISGSRSRWGMWTQNCTHLRELRNIYGDIQPAATVFGFGVFSPSVGVMPNIVRLDLKELTMSLVSFGNMPNLEYLDIRRMNPKLEGEYSLDRTFMSSMSNLRTLVIGDFDTSNITGDGDISFINGNLNNCTLVCTKDTPPATNPEGYIISEILNKVSTILVPSETAKSAYRADSVWGAFAGTWGVYNEGDY